MKWLLTCLVMIGVCAGLQARAVAVDPCSVMSTNHGHPQHHHEHGKPCDPAHDKQCPLEHHDHGCFCHGMPLTDASDPTIRLGIQFRNLERLCHGCESLPDEPFLSEDKPPLI